MILKNVGRSFFRTGCGAPRRRFGARRVGPCVAEVLETRILLAATLFVDPASNHPGDFHTIQAAVNAAASGDTIKVAPGTYQEDVTVTTPGLTILGGQVHRPGESGPSTVEYTIDGFTVSTNDVTIKGFTIEPNPATATTPFNGIFAFNSADSKFVDNLLINTRGITLAGGVTDTQVAANTIRAQNAEGIGLVGGAGSGNNSNDSIRGNVLVGSSIFLSTNAAGARVANNSVSGSTGIQNQADDVTFIDNTSNQNTNGFFESGGTNDTYIDNIARYNSNAGFLIFPAGPQKLLGNTADDNTDGFSVPNDASFAHFFANTADKNGENGFVITGGSPTVLFKVANNNGIAGFSSASVSPLFAFNMADGNGQLGFSIASTGSPKLLDNTADRNGNLGFSIAVGAATIVGNTANENGNSGFSITVTGGTISGNTAEFNRGTSANGDAGFILAGSATVTNNTADRNVGDGFLLEGLVNSTVSHNRADHNGGDGFHLVGSTGNTLTENLARDNGHDGFDVDANSTGNTFSNNTALRNTTDDLSDASTGTGTAGTADTWITNTAHTRNPAGLL